ncbi:hypothetical protein DFH07DRAFT_1068397 [Mycena maculata]|uniref:Uncharacterized protein n=1 Tax=Mycena maculata TaxID=230809 RepID=A0AAD7HAP3_9AGAR|nr:hypothetical protein DFH07DRAFT_1068397 [Mycena maculata]
MRATVSIYEDPAPKSEADVWADDEPKTTLYLIVFASLAVATTMGYAVYRFTGLAESGRGFGSLISKFPHYSPTVSDNLRLRRQ